MDDNRIIYERHDGLGIRQDQHVAVIGCGGIGSWISLYLGLAGVNNIDIYDSDVISENNLNRFPLGPSSVGLNKAEAMAIHIQSLRQGVNVTPRQNFEPDIHSNKLRQYNWVIVSTDSLKSRRMIYDEVVKASRENSYHIGYIECGADGHHATVTFSPATMSTAEETNPGYRSIPVFVGPCTMAASIAAYYVLLATPYDYERIHRVDWDIYAPIPILRLTTINEADEEIEVVEEDYLLNEDASGDDHPLEDIRLVDREADNEQAI